MMIFDHVFYKYSSAVGHIIGGKLRDVIAAVLMALPLCLLFAFIIFLESFDVNSFFLEHFNVWLFAVWGSLLLLALLRYVIYPGSYREKEAYLAANNSVWIKLFVLLYTGIIVFVIWLMYLFVRDYRAQ